jgi:hypothetical protein
MQNPYMQPFAGVQGGSAMGAPAQNYTWGGDPTQRRLVDVARLGLPGGNPYEGDPSYYMARDAADGNYVWTQAGQMRPLDTAGMPMNSYGQQIANPNMPGSPPTNYSAGGAQVGAPVGAPTMGATGAVGAPNPYLANMAQAMTQQSNQNLQQNVMPGIRSQFIGAGGYGGSRQGIAEGVASGMASQGLSNSLANMYGSAWENQANRGQQESQFSRNFGLQSNTAANQQSLSLYDRLLQGAGLGIEAANSIQQQPMNYFLQFMQAANAAGGQGGNASQQMPGNPLLGALGGWQLGSSLFGSRP